MATRACLTRPQLKRFPPLWMFPWPRGSKACALLARWKHRAEFFGEGSDVFNIRDGKRVAALPLATGPNEDNAGFRRFRGRGRAMFRHGRQWHRYRYDRNGSRSANRCHIPPPNQPTISVSTKRRRKVARHLRQPWRKRTERSSPGLGRSHKQAGRETNGGDERSEDQFVGNNRVLILPGRGKRGVRELPSMKSLYSLRPTMRWMDRESIFRRTKNGSWHGARTAWLDLLDTASGKLSQQSQARAAISKVMIAPGSPACYVRSKTALFFSKIIMTTTSMKLSFPELTITGSLRILDYLLNTSLSPDGKRLMIQQGTTGKERLLFFDAASLRPIN